MAHRDSDSTEGLLQDWTYGPCGQEDAVRAVCARKLQPVVDDMWIDDAGNLIGYIGAADRPGDDAAVNERRHRSKSTAAPGAATRVMAHMDELSMLVKRIEPDCALHLTPLGVMYPATSAPARSLYSASIRRSPRCSRWAPSTPPRRARGSGRPNRSGRPSAGLAARLRLHRPQPRRPGRRGRPPRHPGVHRPQQENAGRRRRLRRRLLSRRPRRGHRPAARCSPAVRPRTTTRRRRLSRVHHQRGDRRGGWLLRQRRPAGQPSPSPWRLGRPSRSTRPASPAVRSSATATPCVSTTRTSPTG